MASGTPVITSKISSMPEIAGDAAILIDPLSPPSIAEALLEILGNEDLRQDKIQDGLLNSKRFSWDITAEKVLGIYERILVPSRSPVNARKKRSFEPSFFFFNRPKTEES
jgi:glycosyltransferase involved in cell wall biosynthesis